MRWLFGSYLYPALSGLLSAAGGVAALRIGSAALTTAAALLVYLTSRRLFSGRAALFAMLIFGLNGAAVSLGQFAVYDVLALYFLALALYLTVRAALTARHHLRGKGRDGRAGPWATGPSAVPGAAEAA